MTSSESVKQKFKWLAYLAIVIFLTCLTVNYFSDKNSLNTRFNVAGLSLTKFAINSFCSSIGMLLLCIYNFISSPSKALRYFYIALGGGAIFLMWQSVQWIHLAT